MDIQLYNTLSRKREAFKPLVPNKVGIYHCGPTVYWNQTIGNMRAMVMADLVRRSFAYNGYAVDFVRNYTDVGHLTGDNIGDADSGEDRMEKAAKREQATPDQIADKYIRAFDADTLSLNVIPPTHAPRATSHIEGMIEMVQTLIAKGFAYATPLAVYFDVSKFPEYSKLSGQKADKLESGEGHGSVSDSGKKNPQDFSVWFFKAGAHAKALQTWKSPFSSPLVENGEGFPGWHIECSAMSKHFLGATFDVHMGGVEHISIHHTNEIAQSEAANGAHFVDYWLHNEHLLVDGKKMGKSEGNAYVMDDIKAKGFSPLALRHFFLQANYRSKQNFTWESLEAAQTAFSKLKGFVSRIEGSGTVNKEYKERFLVLLNDDFNVPGALSIAWELTKDTKVSPADAKATLLDFDKVLGLGLADAKKAVISPEAQKLIDERAAARAAKDWKKADELRDKIAAFGLTVKDTADGQQIS